MVFDILDKSPQWRGMSFEEYSIITATKVAAFGLLMAGVAENILRVVYKESPDYGAIVISGLAFAVLFSVKTCEDHIERHRSDLKEVRERIQRIVVQKIREKNPGSLIECSDPEALKKLKAVLGKERGDSLSSDMRLLEDFLTGTNLFENAADDELRILSKDVFSTL